MEEIEKKMWLRVERYVKFLRFIPFLRMVAVCNNLAFSNVNKKSDIDLFVIAGSGHLFTVRILVTSILHLLGVRRHGNKIVGRFCLSFFVDDEFMDLSSIALDNDIYLAVWIRTLVPVINDGAYDEFLRKNLWVNDFFDENIIEHHGFLNFSSYRGGRVKPIFEWLLNGVFGRFFEARLKKWQLKRARLKAKEVPGVSSIIVDEHILKFHNLDRRRDYRGLWFDKYPDSKVTMEKFNTLKSDF